MNDFDGVGRITAAITNNPREFAGIVMATVAIFAIFINALFLQQGRHPAPIFATRPFTAQQRPVALPRPRATTSAATPTVAPVAIARSQAQIIRDIQRELARKGFYDGEPDGIWGAKTDAAARDFAHTAALKINVDASETLLRTIVATNVQRTHTAAPARRDPIAELITKRVLAVQRALADFGYGQIKPTGVYDPATQAAVEKFERARRLPINGQITDDVGRELAAGTGRPRE